MLLESEGGGRCFVLLHKSPCPLSDHWECFSYELWEEDDITIILFSVAIVSLFLICTDYIQSSFIVFFLDVQSPRHSFRTFYLTVKLDITAMIMSQTDVQWIRRAQSISTERQLTSWLLLLLHNLKSKSLYTTCFCVRGLIFTHSHHNPTQQW